MHASASTMRGLERTEGMMDEETIINWAIPQIENSLVRHPSDVSATKEQKGRDHGTTGDCSKTDIESFCVLETSVNGEAHRLL